MTKKKILIILLLVLVVAIIVIGFIFSKDKDYENVEQEESVTEQNDSEKNIQESKDEVEEPEEEQEQREEQLEEQESENVVEEDNGYIVGQELPSEPTIINGVLIANKKYPLPKDFAPGESVEARAAFELMAQDAKKQGFELVAFSTYRSYEYQQSLYNRYVEQDGKDNADRYSARPGYSEHQTGLAFDIGEKGQEHLWLTEEFGESEAGKWLMENAHNYGFILRYPKGKEHITGYMYESWHYRYLGVELATKVKESGLTLEEYLGID